MTSINTNNDVNYDKSCIKGMLVPVLRIVGTAADSLNIDEPSSEYPWLKQESIHMALGYPGDAVREKIVLPVGDQAHYSKSHSL